MKGAREGREKKKNKNLDSTRSMQAEACRKKVEIWTEI